MLPEDHDVQELRSLKGIGDDVDHIMVLSTARRHARGVQRLPDRFDRSRRVAAVQVETDAQAGRVLRTLDRQGRVLHLDVERKQDLHLMSTANDVVRHAEVRQIKPNDLTVDALQALLVDRLGPDLSDVVITVLGTGNLGFKFALRLAESGARVGLEGRDKTKVALLATAINAVLPEYTPHAVEPHRLLDSRVLISVVTAAAVVDSTWMPILTPKALCVDVGIGNLSPDFIASAIQRGHECVRLDVRSAGDPLPLHPNPFFDEVAGRREIDGAPIVAGGLIGGHGEVVVDEILHPTSVIGVADGNGGLLPSKDWSREIEGAVERVRASIAQAD